MSEMAMVPEVPEIPGQSGARGTADPRPGALSAAVWFAASLAGSAVLGLLGGLIWGEVAPRALLQKIGAGAAEVVNPETRAYFGADAWFVAIAAVAGLLTGVLGFRLAVARRDGVARAVAAAGLIAGAVAGAFVMMWLGGQIGLSGYSRHLASSRDGALFYESLSLGAKSALALWPLFTAAVLLVAEWGTRPGSDPGPGPDPEPGQPGD
ncbi:MAG TPA: hypothetical protein VHF26_15415 [Trebonia sp.]|nr:hypothetical protein [Trebonia sp.]